MPRLRVALLLGAASTVWFLSSCGTDDGATVAQSIDPAAIGACPEDWKIESENPYPDLWSRNDAWGLAEGLIEVADVSPAHGRVLEEETNLDDIPAVPVTLTEPMALEGARAIPEGAVLSVPADIFKEVSAISQERTARVLVSAAPLEELRPWDDDAARSGLWAAGRVALVLEDESLVFAGHCAYRTTDAIERFLDETGRDDTGLGLVEALVADPAGPLVTEFVDFFVPPPLTWADMPVDERSIEGAPAEVRASLEWAQIRVVVPEGWTREEMRFCVLTSLGLNTCRMSSASHKTEFTVDAHHPKGEGVTLFISEGLDGPRVAELEITATELPGLAPTVRVGGTLTEPSLVLEPPG